MIEDIEPSRESENQQRNEDISTHARAQRATWLFLVCCPPSWACTAFILPFLLNARVHWWGPCGWWWLSLLTHSLRQASSTSQRKIHVSLSCPHKHTGLLISFCLAYHFGCDLRMYIYHSINVGVTIFFCIFSLLSRPARIFVEGRWSLSWAVVTELSWALVVWLLSM